jgi:hypothetical protein
VSKLLVARRVLTGGLLSLTGPSLLLARSVLACSTKGQIWVVHRWIRLSSAGVEGASGVGSVARLRSPCSLFSSGFCRWLSPRSPGGSSRCPRHVHRPGCAPRVCHRPWSLSRHLAPPSQLEGLLLYRSCVLAGPAIAWSLPFPAMVVHRVGRHLLGCRFWKDPKPFWSPSGPPLAAGSSSLSWPRLPTRVVTQSPYPVFDWRQSAPCGARWQPKKFFWCSHIKWF